VVTPIGNGSMQFRSNLIGTESTIIPWFCHRGAEVRRRHKILALLDGWVDLDEGIVHRSDDAMKLKPKELALLCCLVNAGTRTVTRGEIMVDVWGYRPDALTKTLDVTVNRLRSKIEVDPSSPTQLQTVRGQGYRLVPLKSTGISSQIKTNIRLINNAFVGRDNLVLDLAEFLQSSTRLVTLVGLGGVGKTRLAMELALRVSSGFPGGVWLLDLSDVRDMDDLVATIASTLDLRLTGDEPCLSIGHAMRGYGQALWIVDNFEQLYHLAASTILLWQQTAPESSFLVTSRRPLSLDVETVVEVPPFADAPSPSDDQNAAAQLFVARSAELWGPGTLRDEDWPAIEALVELLEGVPLAIELAAVRSKLLPVDELQRRLRKNFDVLRSRVRDRTRHASLDASVQWSWDLLSPWKQSALMQCTVFASRFSVTAAEEIIDLSDWPEAPHVLDVVEELVDEHLLARSRVGDAERLEFMDIIRRFVTARTPDDDNSIQAAHTRHATHFSRYGDEPYLPRLRMPQCRCEPHLLSDHLLAMDFAEAQELHPLMLANGRAAVHIYEAQGPVIKALQLIKRLVALPGCGAEWRMRFGLDLASIRSAWSVVFDDECLEILSSAQTCAAEIGDRGFRGAFCAFESFLLANQGKYSDAVQIVKNAFADLRSNESWSWMTFCLSHQGSCYMAIGDWHEAASCFTAALEFEDRNNAIQNGFLHNNSAIMVEMDGDYDAAAEHYQIAIDYFESFGHARFANRSRMDRGLLLQLIGESDQAIADLEQVQTYFQRIDDGAYAWMTSGILAQVRLARGETQQATNMLLALSASVPPGLPNSAFHKVWHQIQLGVAWTRLGRETEASSVLEMVRETLHGGDLSKTYLAFELELAYVEFHSTFARPDQAQQSMRESERRLKTYGAKANGPHHQKLDELRDRFS
jgi:predicted ATPase/DNA-binding winged helix-turn-helix (wHTH) protein/tetratricopeptide (TPR) repeat protein